VIVLYNTIDLTSERYPYQRAGKALARKRIICESVGHFRTSLFEIARFGGERFSNSAQKGLEANFLQFPW
jgi:hypothetical protein